MPITYATPVVYLYYIIIICIIVYLYIQTMQLHLYILNIFCPVHITHMFKCYWSLHSVVCYAAALHIWFIPGRSTWVVGFSDFFKDFSFSLCSMRTRITFSNLCFKYHSNAFNFMGFYRYLLLCITQTFLLSSYHLVYGKSEELLPGVCMEHTLEECYLNKGYDSEIWGLVEYHICFLIEWFLWIIYCTLNNSLYYVTIC